VDSVSFDNAGGRASYTVYSVLVSEQFRKSFDLCLFGPLERENCLPQEALHPG